MLKKVESKQKNCCLPIVVENNEVLKTEIQCLIGHRDKLSYRGAPILKSLESLN